MNDTASRDTRMTAEEIQAFFGDCTRDERLLLDTKGNLVYSGLFIETLEVDGEAGMLLRLDEKSGLSVWCPHRHIGRVSKVFSRSGETRSS
jgi:hypothetical protein